MNVNWDAIRSALMAALPFIIFVVVMVPLIVVTAIQVTRMSTRKEPEKSPDVIFLEGALDDDAPRKPNPNYSYEEFQRDLHDERLTFEEIYEKCGGVLPKKPEEGQLGFGPQGPQGPVKVGDTWMIPSDHGPQGYQDPDGGREQSPRMKELQEWFKERGKTSHVGGLVPPPPNPYPIIHKIYLRRR